MTDTPTPEPTPRALLGDFGESYAVVRDARREVARLAERLEGGPAPSVLGPQHDDARRRLAYLEAGLLAHADRVIDEIRAGALSDHVGDPSPAEEAFPSLVGLPAGFYRDRGGDVWEVREDGLAGIVLIGDAPEEPEWRAGDALGRDDWAPFVPVPKPEALS